jgi:hypothetical protein
MTPVRVLSVLALALSLVGCNGDRMKDGNLQQPNLTTLVVLTT